MTSSLEIFFFIVEINRFHVAVGLYSKRSQTLSRYGKDIQ